jgi:hypothetical protein
MFPSVLLMEGLRFESHLEELPTVIGRGLMLRKSWSIRNIKNQLQPSCTQSCRRGCQERIMNIGDCVVVLYIDYLQNSLRLAYSYQPI